ncbi:hypothetical protein M409DRAFT_61490 [Zasmidium cellare ATCC 36951]|uniref:Uncharacterized protein n=1 Tax=Zasmidium cellare ATCC 36951 TaxID=1080233 RepID=A0A6A6BYV0_ZASCE|nr:uncharacterized protein M409DRAFT_61490 [Zasmidium cellare ATCC 36951]KAF2158596.1 hypothetical protein M409DRAFT_61490 [Zasmidium cellare ATCC 36951]
MHSPKLACALLGLQMSSAFAAPSVAVQEPGKQLDKRIGCPGGGFLVYSVNNADGSYTFCLGVASGIALVWTAGITSAAAAVYLTNAWRNGTCGAPVSATVQAGSDSKRALPTPTVDKRTPTLAKRDPAVTAYSFQVESGYDSHQCNFTLTDDQWAQAAHAISEYMIDYEDECVQVIVAGDSGYEGNTLT